jgi:hypothetical protein
MVIVGDDEWRRGRSGSVPESAKTRWQTSAVEQPTHNTLFPLGKGRVDR